MKTPALAFAATLLATAALAQTATPGTSAPGATSNAPIPGVNSTTGVTPRTGVVDRNTGTVAASGDRNQAVATTDANAPQPARGRNSFTEGEARRRLESRGFASVSGLRKDEGGVWRGQATRDGQPTGVWLDYKGNVGQQSAAARAGAARGNPPGTAASRATDRTLGTNATGTNPGANAPDGTPGNPPGTAAGRAVDRTLGTNTTDANRPDGAPGNPPSTALGRAVDRAQGDAPRPDGTPGNPPGTAVGRALGTTGTAPR